MKFGRWKSVKSCVVYLTKISHGSPLFSCRYCADRAQNLLGPAPTMFSEYSRFYPNRLTFSGVIAERVNTAKMRRKINPIFVWSLATNRIISKWAHFSRRDTCLESSSVDTWSSAQQMCHIIAIFLDKFKFNAYHALINFSTPVRFTVTDLVQASRMIAFLWHIMSYKNIYYWNVTVYYCCYIFNTFK